MIKEALESYRMLNSMTLGVKTAFEFLLCAFRKLLNLLSIMGGNNKILICNKVIREIPQRVFVRIMSVHGK